MKRLLTIAGSDSGGGAGIQADLKTFHQFGCFGMSVITAVTAQNTQGVHGVEELSPEIIAAQLEAVVTDIGVDAAKTGMLSSSTIIDTLAPQILEFKIANLVVDPVMRAKGGDALLQDSAQKALIDKIIPLAEVVTPNIPEAEVLSDINIQSTDDMKKVAEIIHRRGAKNVLVKGGHLDGVAVDVLYDGSSFHEFSEPRLDRKNTHGTGCTLSAAIAANLALGLSLIPAVANSKKFITRAIRESMELGKGIGPLNHFVSPQ